MGVSIEPQKIKQSKYKFFFKYHVQVLQMKNAFSMNIEGFSSLQRLVYFETSFCKIYHFNSVIKNSSHDKHSTMNSY